MPDTTFERLYDHPNFADLPVAAAADEIADSVLKPQVTVLSAETGSGKTLYVASKLAEHWQDVAGEDDEKTVLVLVPKRSVAINAATAIAKYSETKLGESVGFAIGRRPGDESRFSGKTKLLFATYGFALSSKMIDKASVVVMDDMHEGDSDIALTRALLRNRMEWGDKVKVLEMSATIDANKQAKYWEEVAPTEIFKVEGKVNECERRERPRGSIEDSAIELLKEGKKGILIFRPGLAEIKETKKILARKCAEELQRIEDEVRAKMSKSGLTYLGRDRDIEFGVRKAQEASGLLGLEMEHIHGEMPRAQREAALRDPEDGHAKILIGTNVIESGMNIPWVDSGVSCGTCKQKHVDRFGAHSLDLEEMPQWRLVQQEGRVRRFKPGVFVLASDTLWKDRPLETVSELERLPLTDMLMQVLRYNLDPRRLVFEPPLDPVKLEQGKKELMRLGLIDEEFHATEAGKFAAQMPLTAESAATLWHAKQLGVLRAALPVAALMIAGSIRLDHRRSHGKDSNSDQLDALKAFLEASNCSDPARPDPKILEALNINDQKYLSAYALFDGLVKTVDNMPDCASQQAQASEAQIRQCVLAGKLNRFFRIKPNESLLLGLHHDNGFRTDNHSTVRSVKGSDYAVARLDVVNSGTDRAQTTASDVTIIDRHDLLELAKVRPDALEIRRQTISGRVAKLELKLCGDTVPFDTIYPRVTHAAAVGRHA